MVEAFFTIYIETRSISLYIPISIFKNYNWKQNYDTRIHHKQQNKNNYCVLQNLCILHIRHLPFRFSLFYILLLMLQIYFNLHKGRTKSTFTLSASQVEAKRIWICDGKFPRSFSDILFTCIHIYAASIINLCI